MAELFAALLEAITPKSRAGKVVWGVVFAVFLVFAVIEILAALGY